MECTKCNASVMDGAAYCVNCGALLEGKTACAGCGTVYEGNFCPACGTAKKAVKADEGKNKSTFAKISDIIGGASMMLGVIFSLFFVFFIGLILQGEMNGTQVTQSENIFYFFGDFYKEMKDLDTSDMGMTKWFSSLIQTHTTLYGVVGTVISALTILSVVAFAVVAIVKYTLAWLNGEEVKIDGWALATVLSFLVGSALFYAHIRFAGNVEATVEQEEIYLDIFTKFDKTTVAGIVLCAISVVIGVVFRLLAKGKEFWTKQTIGKMVLSGLGLACACTVFALAKNVAIVGEIGVMLGVANAKVEGGYMLVNVVSDILMGAATSTEMKSYYQITQNLSTLNVYNVIAQILLIALAVWSALMVLANVRGVAGEKQSGMIWSILSTLTAAALLVFTILSFNCLSGIVDLLVEEMGAEGYEYSLRGNYGSLICSIIFSAFMLALSIIRWVLVKREQNAK